MKALQMATESLAGKFPSSAIRWTAPEQLHLTLNFLGAIENERIWAFGGRIAVRQRRIFELYVARGGTRMFSQCKAGEDRVGRAERRFGKI
jgi:2'-5' RNA ligase